MRKILSIMFALPALFLPLCTPIQDSPLDEDSPKFVTPVIGIDTAGSSLKPNDTIHFDTASLVLVGNLKQSRFQVRIDTLTWSAWKEAGAFSFNSLLDGKHMVHINTMYYGGLKIFSDSIDFFVKVAGYRPLFALMTDTVIAIDTGKSVAITVKATGSEPMSYMWLKDDFIMPKMSNDSLEVSPFTFVDAAFYRCIAYNEYGKDTSRVFIVKFRPSIGGIRGVIANSKDSGKLSGGVVVLTEKNMKDTCNSDGFFEFNRILSGTYSIKTVQAGYKDKTISFIEVNDSTIKDLGAIYLTAIDTVSTDVKVAYDGNGNTGGSIPVDAYNYKSGMIVTIRGNTGNLAKTGYTFAGWSNMTDGKGGNYSPGDTFSIGANSITLFAKWTTQPTRSIIYNGNGYTGGNVPLDSNKYISGAIITILGNIGNLAKADCIFKGWNAKNDGTGKGYQAGDTFFIGDSNMTLFAKWVLVFTVIYIGNGNTAGSVPTDSNKYETGATVTVLGNPGNLLKTGYSFAGWNTEDDGSGTNYNAGATFVMSSSPKTLNGKWTTKPTYSITYNDNGKTGGTAPATVNCDSGVVVTISGHGGLVKTGYSFTGWNSSSDGSGKSYIAGAKVTMDTVNITLYAQWAANTYTVKYKGNGNTGGNGPDSTNHFYGAQVTVAAVGTLVKIGYSFLGWNTDSLGKGIDYAAGATLTIGASNMTFYARWKINQYSVTFNSIGGNVIPSQSIKHSDTVTMPPTPVKQSYIFSGWFKDSIFMQPWNFKTKITEPTILYVKWVITDIDKNIYTEVTIGSQVWMVENLRTSRYRDSTELPLVVENAFWAILSTPAYCWYARVPINNNKLGALYNWHVVDPKNPKKIAPDGWHVPTDEEWGTLIAFLGGEETAGGKLKESGTTHWNSPNAGATNSSGFSGLPAGWRFYDGEYDGIGTNCYWWTTTLHYSDDPLRYGINCYNSDVVRIDTHRNYGLSVRCIRDW